MKLKDEQRITADIRREYIRDPLVQSKVRVSPDNVTAAAALTAHRGWQVGIHDAYKTIRRTHPEAAKDILQAFNMNAKGNISLSVRINQKEKPAS